MYIQGHTKAWTVLHVAELYVLVAGIHEAINMIKIKHNNKTNNKAKKLRPVHCTDIDSGYDEDRIWEEFHCTCSVIASEVLIFKSVGQLKKQLMLCEVVIIGHRYHKVCMYKIFDCFSKCIV